MIGSQSKSWRVYFKSAHNYNDLFQYLTTLWIVVADLLDANLPPIADKRVLCVFVIISQGIKAVLDWLRLFDNTSFYVTLISRTITDIGYIGLIIAIILVYVGCSMYMLQLNSSISAENDIVSPIFNVFIFDSVLNQYLLMLGEFNMDAFQDHANLILCYLIFISSTFIT